MFSTAQSQNIILSQGSCREDGKDRDRFEKNYPSFLVVAPVW